MCRRLVGTQAPDQNGCSTEFTKFIELPGTNAHHPKTHIPPFQMSPLLGSVNGFPLLTLRANPVCLSLPRSNAVQNPPARIFSKTALLPPLLLFRYDSTLFK
jgi:hypothetical protein